MTRIQRETNADTGRDRERQAGPRSGVEPTTVRLRGDSANHCTAELHSVPPVAQNLDLICWLTQETSGLVGHQNGSRDYHH